MNRFLGTFISRDYILLILFFLCTSIDLLNKCFLYEWDLKVVAIKQQNNYLIRENRGSFPQCEMSASQKEVSKVEQTRILSCL